MFGLGEAVRPTGTTGVIGISGRKNAIGIVRIKIRFTALSLVIAVDFLVLAEAIPTLLSTKDMMDNDVDISLAHKRISYQGKHHPLALEDYFLIHRWQPADLPYAMHTCTELRHIHRSFGHPSVCAPMELLKRAQGDDLDPETRKSLRNIEKQCSTCRVTSANPRHFKLTIGSRVLR